MPHVVVLLYEARILLKGGWVQSECELDAGAAPIHTQEESKLIN